MKKLLNIPQFLSFLLTIMVSITGICVHKLAFVCFLLLCIVHTVIYRRKLGEKRWKLLGLVFLSFAKGPFGMILDQYPVILMLHQAVSVAVVFFLAILIFVFHKRIRCKTSIKAKLPNALPELSTHKKAIPGNKSQVSPFIIRQRPVLIHGNGQSQIPSGLSALPDSGL